MTIHIQKWRPLVIWQHNKIRKFIELYSISFWHISISESQDRTPSFAHKHRLSNTPTGGMNYMSLQRKYSQVFQGYVQIENTNNISNTKIQWLS